MLNIDTGRLTDALESVPAFKLPEMSAGTAYLHEKLILPLSAGKEVLLTDLDLDAFDSEDVGLLDRLYDSVYAKNNLLAASVVIALSQSPPVSNDAGYV